MKLLLAAHDSSLRHDTGALHPERPERIPAVVRGIMSAGVEVTEVAPDLAGNELLGLVHDADYVSRLESFCAAGGGPLDRDTFVGRDSWEAALRAAAAGPLLCDLLAAGAGDLGYVAMRPPGHHAVPDRAMGFCLFNNVAISAARLEERGERVAIVDWDVHHGNGTQSIFYTRPNVLYLSIHQEGIYPGTGASSELGQGAGAGRNLNVPVPARTHGALHRRVMAEVFAPIIVQFAPDWLLVSCGYDAHAADPLASLRLVASDYAAMARTLSESVPSSRTVVFLEGGYDLEALRDSAAATVQGWLQPESVIADAVGDDHVEECLRRAAAAAARHWNL